MTSQKLKIDSLPSRSLGSKDRLMWPQMKEDQMDTCQRRYNTPPGVALTLGFPESTGGLCPEPLPHCGRKGPTPIVKRLEFKLVRGDPGSWKNRVDREAFIRTF